MYIPIENQSLSVQKFYDFLLANRDHNKHFKMSYNSIGERLGVHLNTCYNIMSRLKKSGHVEVIDSGRRGGCVYMIYDDSELRQNAEKAKRKLIVDREIYYHRGY